MKFNAEKAVTRKDALRLMKENWKFNPETEIVGLNECIGRVTANDVRSVTTIPVVRASKRDGIAVRSSDFEKGMPDTAGWIKGVDYVRADTGDDFPDQYDNIIAVEDVIFEGDSIRFRDGYLYDPEEKAVNYAGSTVMKDEIVAPKNTRITPEVLAAITIGGVSQVSVIKKIKVIFIPTGSELVPPGSCPERGQNIETNGVMLGAMLRSRGAEFTSMPIVRDDRAELEKALDKAVSDADFVIINGGSSRGEEDYNSYLIESKASYFRHGVLAVPARPLGMAIIDGKPVINVPGPVRGAQLAEHWFLSSLINYWYGLPDPEYPKVIAKLETPVKKRPNFEMIASVALTRSDEGFIARVLGKNEASVPGMLLKTDGYVNIPIGVSSLEAGTEVEVELLKAIELI